ncbi:RNA polymerase sigma factor [Cytobacillus praedii]|uniref:RNA polymerase sigma factor n=1 Tax=Cytobacillus praedii TaxID=1742358 RepID=UPI003AF8C74B
MGKKNKFNHDELFTSFIRENKENFYRLAYIYVKNSEDALDIVQDSIHKAIISIDSLQDLKTLKSWFYRIVVNTSLDFLRKHKRVSIVDAETMEFISSGSEDHYENIDLERALDQLSPEYKSIIVLRFFEDLKIEEVADVLNENVNTIKTRLYKALKLLRIELNDEIIKGAN